MAVGTEALVCSRLIAETTVSKPVEYTDIGVCLFVSFCAGIVLPARLAPRSEEPYQGRVCLIAWFRNFKKENEAAHAWLCAKEK